ncbi:MAG TPA: sugar phosphate isomerase/epimerase family protein [Chitinophagaceae bacterium]|jgi:sugar phosphate isomerase/epimerase
MLKKALFFFSVFLLKFSVFSQTVNPDKDWKLGVQLWTFNTSSFYTAIKKADSCKIKYVEAFPGQLLKEGGRAEFGPSLSPDERKAVKDFLHKKGITIVAIGVVVARTKEEWKQYFEFAADMKIPVITAEPEWNQLNDVNRLAGAYGIQVAIHDHPVPNIYWHPDSVVRAMKGHASIGVCADIGHWARNGLNVVDCIKKCDGKILVVHLKDVSEFGNVQTPDVLLGEGVCNIPAVLQQLKKQEFKGIFSIEYEENPDNNVKDIKQYVQYFHEQVGKLK